MLTTFMLSVTEWNFNLTSLFILKQSVCKWAIIATVARHIELSMITQLHIHELHSDVKRGQNQGRGQDYKVEAKNNYEKVPNND